jgi:uncharacterized membrane protein
VSLSPALPVRSPRWAARLAVIAWLPTLLGGCGRVHHAPAQLPAPLLKALGRKGAVNTAGEQPAVWSVDVRPGLIRATVEGQPTLTTGIDSFAGTTGSDTAGRASWSGKAAGGATVQVTVEAKPCRDVETGMPYGLTAQAEIAGRNYAGCAAPPGQGLGPRQ